MATQVHYSFRSASVSIFNRSLFIIIGGEIEMSKEIDEFYKQYSARIMELDDTPLFASGTFGTFMISSVEEYDKMQKQISVLEKQRNNYRHKRNEYRNKVRVLQKQLADSESQNKRVLEKLELIVRSNQELEKALGIAVNIANLKSNHLWTVEEIKDKAKERLKKDE